MIYFFLVVLIILLPVKVSAYLDPGSGSLIIQVIIAAIAGAGFAIKLYWRKIKSIFTKKDKNKEKDGEDIKPKNE